MKKLLRKNQIIITALVVMVALAGYLSLTDEEDLAVGVLNQSEQAAGDEKDAAGPLQAIFSSFRFWENWKNSACEGTQAVLAMTLYRLFRQR